MVIGKDRFLVFSAIPGNNPVSAYYFYLNFFRTLNENEVNNWKDL